MQCLITLDMNYGLNFLCFISNFWQDFSPVYFKIATCLQRQIWKTIWYLVVEILIDFLLHVKLHFNMKDDILAGIAWSDINAYGTPKEQINIDEKTNQFLSLSRL